MMPQAIGQAPFYFYNTDSKHDVRQHYPQQQMHMYPMVPTLPSTPVYSRPSSASNSQPPTLYSNGPAVMTPTASPQPMSHKPAILLENELYENSYFPSTPPLSTSGSTIGSPSACEVLQTPMNPMFSGLDGIDGFKEALEPVETAVLDWSNCGSPPMTPGKSTIFIISSISNCLKHGITPWHCAASSGLSLFLGLFAGKLAVLAAPQPNHVLRRGPAVRCHST